MDTRVTTVGRSDDHDDPGDVGHSTLGLAGIASYPLNAETIRPVDGESGHEPGEVRRPTKDSENRSAP
jgi:hypothetical protein